MRILLILGIFQGLDNPFRDGEHRDAELRAAGKEKVGKEKGKR
jgi:hypothetical protein